MKILWLAAAVSALASCATTPGDLREPEGSVLPVGVVTKVEKQVRQGQRSQGGMAGVAGMGIAGALIGGALADFHARETVYVHEITTGPGMVEEEWSAVEFPVGTCVALGLGPGKKLGRLTLSTRCTVGR